MQPPPPPPDKYERATYWTSPRPVSYVLMVPVGHQLGQHWRASSRFKWLAALIAALLVVQYLYGASVYKVDVRIWKYYSPGQLFQRDLQSSSPQEQHRPSLDQIQPIVIDAGQPTDKSISDADLSETVDSSDQKQSSNLTSADNVDSANVTTTLIDAVTAGHLESSINVSTTSTTVIPSTNQSLAAANSSSLAVVSTTPGSSSQPVTFATASPNLKDCALIPPVLVGPIKVWFDYPSFDELSKLYPHLEPGGHGRPAECRSHHRVAIIIPYRDRERQLRAFLHNLHSLLTKQQLDYAIFIVEQVANQTFNRAKLMNIGYVEANKLYDWQCYIFHDVDLLPEDDRNLYTCPDQPRHMSVGVDKFNYKLLYGSLFGGITAFTRAQFEKVNGYSNDYWGWGGEDDDMSSRVTLNGYKISRYPTNIARYKMIKHSHEKSNPINACRYKLMYKTKRRWRADGLNALKYDVKSVVLQPMYTKITVDLREKDEKKHLKEVGIKC